MRQNVAARAHNQCCEYQRRGVGALGISMTRQPGTRTYRVAMNVDGIVGQAHATTIYLNRGTMITAIRGH